MNKRPGVIYEGTASEKQVDVLGFGVYNGITRAIVEKGDGNVRRPVPSPLRIRRKLRDARRKRLPKKPPTPRTQKITCKAEDYPKTGEFFKHETHSYYRQIYESKCETCGRTLRVLGQRDNGSPEYEDDIIVQCICGDGVDFAIPVN